MVVKSTIFKLKTININIYIYILVILQPQFEKHV